MTATAAIGAPIELALGTVQFGLAYGVVGSGQRVTDDEARAILQAAAAQGVRVLDTAAAYGDIEQRLAGLCGTTPYSVVSKIAPLPAGCDAQTAARLVRESVERSCERLGPRLHALLFHSADDLLGPLGDLAWAQASACCLGLGVRLGVSVYGPQQLHAVLARYPVALAQLPGNALDQRLMAHRFDGVELHLRSAFLQGLLLADAAVAGARVPAAAPALKRWQVACTRLGLGALEAALGAVKALPGVRCCVVGVESVAQLEDIAAAWRQAQPLYLPGLATDDAAVIDPRTWRTP